jgi:hypothetical protein
MFAQMQHTHREKKLSWLSFFPATCMQRFLVLFLCQHIPADLIDDAQGVTPAQAHFVLSNQAFALHARTRYHQWARGRFKKKLRYLYQPRQNAAAASRQYRPSMSFLVRLLVLSRAYDSPDSKHVFKYMFHVSKKACMIHIFDAWQGETDLDS